MAAPTFVAEYETVWNVNTSPKTVTPTVSAGDWLVAVAAAEDSPSTLGITNTGGLTFVSQVAYNPASGRCPFSIWTCQISSGGSFNVGFTINNSNRFGGNVLRFSGVTSVGTPTSVATGSGAGAAPSVNITTTQANSVIIVVATDWNATGGTRTWRTNAGSFSEQTGQLIAGVYYAGAGFHPDSGAVGTYAVGQSAPTGQTYAVAAVELLGTASSGGGGNYNLLDELGMQDLEGGMGFSKKDSMQPFSPRRFVPRFEVDKKSGLWVPSRRIAA